MGSAVYGSIAMGRIRGVAAAARFAPDSSIYCKCRAYNAAGNGNGGNGERAPQDALLRALTEASKREPRLGKSVNLVFGGHLPEEQWRALDERVNLYPMVRRFTAIGKGGDDFAQAMVVAVETVLQSPVPRAWVSKRFSSRGKYISVRIGPVLVNSGDQVRAVYNAMKRDVRMKFFL